MYLIDLLNNKKQESTKGGENILRIYQTINQNTSDVVITM